MSSLPFVSLTPRKTAENSAFKHAFAQSYQIHQKENDYLALGNNPSDKESKGGMGYPFHVASVSHPILPFSHSGGSVGTLTDI